MINIEIEQNVPLPRSTAGRTTFAAGRPAIGFSIAFLEMKVGDSFLIPLGDETSLTVSNRIRARASYNRIRVSIRTKGDSIRVWRVK